MKDRIQKCAIEIMEVRKHGINSGCAMMANLNSDSESAVTANDESMWYYLDTCKFISVVVQEYPDINK